MLISLNLANFINYFSAQPDNLGAFFPARRKQGLFGSVWISGLILFLVNFRKHDRYRVLGSVNFWGLGRNTTGTGFSGFSDFRDFGILANFQKSSKNFWLANFWQYNYFFSDYVDMARRFFELHWIERELGGSSKKCPLGSKKLKG